MVDKHAQVLVVGGSLVGLCAALFLRRHAVDVLLVEKQPSTSLHPRTPGYNARTVELFRVTGVEESLRAADSWDLTETGLLWAETLASDNYHWINPPGIRESQADFAHVSPSEQMTMSQDKLEPVLREYAERRGAELRFGTELVSIQQDTHGVSAVTVDRETGERSDISAEYVIAADGASSPLRERLGIAREGLGLLERAVGIMIRGDVRDLLDGRSFAICQVENPNVSAMIRIVGELLSLNINYSPERGETVEQFTDRRCVELARAAVGVDDLDVEVVDVRPWEARAEVAERFVDGRVFLAGDAAHVMSPSGAYGANTGIQDVWNLSWKLGFVLNGWADVALLDSYAEQRRPIAVRTVDQSLVRGNLWFGADLPVDAELIDDLTLTFGYRYGAGHDFEDPRQPTGEPGTRLPHVPLERDGINLSTVDLWGAGLLLLAGSDGDAWLKAADELSQRCGVPIAAYQVGSTEVGGLRDPNQRWPGASRTTSTGAVLVQPDGFIAWRAATMPGDPIEALDTAMRVSLGR